MGINNASWQARDAWGNNPLDLYFNLTADLFPVTEDAIIAERSSDISSVTFFGNGSGIATVVYVPKEAGPNFLRGE